MVALGRALLFGINGRQNTTKRYALIQSHVPPDDGCFPNHYPGAMVDEKPTRNGRARMNFNIRHPARKLHDKARDEFFLHPP